ncbi:MAG: DcaP family trimeric outer membrane transporter [Cyclobacteriaceae bacterium]|nr:DcaP family trimeric outer membrane transporter [Cyclobacteriaceae bacterium]
MTKKFFYSTAILTFCVVAAYGQSQSAADELPAGWWQIPKTTTQIKAGGYVKFDFIHDFNPIGSPDFFDVSKIPTDGSEGASSHLNAKETRLFVDVKSTIKNTSIRTYVEGDFYGSGSAFRLRMAFLEIGKHWLVGQTWSNFMDESIIPATLDFEKPGAYAFARNPMVRYKMELSKSSYLAFALEQPVENDQKPVESGAFYSPFPDLNARFRVSEKWGHIQLSAFLAHLTYEYTAGGNDKETFYGGNLSGRLNVAKADYLFFQGLYGPGIGRYRGGMSSGLDADGNLEAIVDKGFTLGYEHRWCNAFTSLVVYNHGINENTEGQPSNSLYQTNYGANLGHFVPRRAHRGRTAEVLEFGPWSVPWVDLPSVHRSASPS